MNIRDMQKAAFENARDHGWHDKPLINYGVINTDSIAARVSLIHSEASEATEELREATTARDLILPRFSESGKPECFGIELADIVIRCMDLAGQLGIDLQDAIILKHEYNKTRPFRHGGKKL